MTESVDASIIIKESPAKKLAFDSSFGEILGSRHEVRIIKRMTDEAVSSYSPPNLISGDSEFAWDNNHEVWEQIMSGGKPTVRRNQDEPVMSTLGRGTFLVPGEIMQNEELGVEVQVLGISNRAMKGTGFLQYTGVAGQVSNPDRIDKSAYFKITREGKSFFVKKSTATQNPGYSEFKNTVNVKKALQHLEYVDVINARLGYQDDKESWFVSDWADIESAGYSNIEVLNLGGINDYGVLADKKIEFSKSKLTQHVAEITKSLERKGIHLGADMGFNIFYNPTTNRILLLDITNKFSPKLNQPKK